MIQSNKGLSVQNVMDCLNCTKSYVYRLIRDNELEVIEGTIPVRIEVDSIILKIKKLYPWIVDNLIINLHYKLKELELKHSY
jgi:hypothetical protein